MTRSGGSLHFHGLNVSYYEYVTVTFHCRHRHIDYTFCLLFLMIELFIPSLSTIIFSNRRLCFSVLWWAYHRRPLSMTNAFARKLHSLHDAGVADIRLLSSKDDWTIFQLRWKCAVVSTRASLYSSFWRMKALPLFTALLLLPLCDAGFRYFLLLGIAEWRGWTEYYW